MAKANNNKNKKNQKKGFTPREKRVEVTEITYSSPITVGELAEKLNRNSSELIKVLFMLGTMVTINSSLDDEQIEFIESNVMIILLPKALISSSEYTNCCVLPAGTVILIEYLPFFRYGNTRVWSFSMT